jgi:hypothetical protein
MLKKILNLIKQAYSCFKKKYLKFLNLKLAKKANFGSAQPAWKSHMGVEAWADISSAHLGRIRRSRVIFGGSKPSRAGHSREP